MEILLADDERLALEVLKEAVHKACPDASLYDFQKTGELLEFAVEHPCDVAFLDIEMRSMNGIELAKRLKEINPSVNIVFATGYSEYMGQAFSMHVSGYLLKPVTWQAVKEELENLRHPVAQERDTGLRIQTFGNFEVFYNGRPLRFARSKAKELFAYLIHKRGTGCGTREIAALLFEDQPYSLTLQKQVQTIMSAMMKSLKEVGAEDCIIRTYNYTAVDVKRIENCDYYRFLKWDVKAVNEYTGEYMMNYSWAEFVIGYLDNKLM